MYGLLSCIYLAIYDIKGYMWRLNPLLVVFELGIHKSTLNISALLVVFQLSIHKPTHICISSFFYVPPIQLNAG